MTFRLPQALLDTDDEQALAYLDAYFHSGGYTGALFDVWDSDGRRGATADQFTADDLVAVSFLSVNVPPKAAEALLSRGNNPYNALLHEIGEDRDLAAEPEPPSSSHPAWALDLMLRRLPDVGRTIASKLMASKRPRLVPVFDEVVNGVMSLTPQHWVPLHSALRDDHARLQRKLLDLHARSGLPDQVSVLRVLDVIAWMEGQALRRHPRTPQADPASLPG